TEREPLLTIEVPFIKHRRDERSLKRSNQDCFWQASRISTTDTAASYTRTSSITPGQKSAGALELRPRPTCNAPPADHVGVANDAVPASCGACSPGASGVPTGHTYNRSSSLCAS